MPDGQRYFVGYQGSFHYSLTGNTGCKIDGEVFRCPDPFSSARTTQILHSGKSVLIKVISVLSASGLFVIITTSFICISSATQEMIVHGLAYSSWSASFLIIKRYYRLGADYTPPLLPLVFLTSTKLYFLRAAGNGDIVLRASVVLTKLMGNCFINSQVSFLIMPAPIMPSHINFLPAITSSGSLRLFGSIHPSVISTRLNSGRRFKNIKAGMEHIVFLCVMYAWTLLKKRRKNNMHSHTRTLGHTTWLRFLIVYSNANDCR